MDGLENMNIGDVLSYCITWTNYMTPDEAGSAGTRQATQEDINTFLGI